MRLNFRIRQKNDSTKLRLLYDAPGLFDVAGAYGFSCDYLVSQYGLGSHGYTGADSKLSHGFILGNTAGKNEQPGHSQSNLSETGIHD